MTAERMQQLADNAKINYCDSKMMQELIVYLAETEAERLRALESNKYYTIQKY